MKLLSWGLIYTIILTAALAVGFGIFLMLHPLVIVAVMGYVFYRIERKRHRAR